MTVLAIAAGLLIGLSLGALGGGGSILTVPALVYLLGQNPHQATSASLLVVGIAALVGAATHARAGRVRLKAGAVFGVLGVAGSYLGSRLSAAVPENVLLAGFGLLMLVAASAMVIRQRRGRRARSAEVVDVYAPAQARAAGAGSAASGGTVRKAAGDRADGGPGSHVGTLTLEPPAPAAAGRPAAVAPADSSLPARGRRRRGPLAQAGLVLAAATAVGLVTGFFGVGGGFLVVPVLVLVLGFDMATAAGTSLVVIAIDSAAALASRAGHGALTLDWAMVGAFVAAAVLGALAGGKLAGRISQQRLAGAFTALIAVVAVYTLARSIPGLI